MNDLQKAVAVIVVLVASNIGTFAYFQRSNQHLRQSVSQEISVENDGQWDFHTLMNITGGACQSGQGCATAYIDCTELKIKANASQCQLVEQAARAGYNQLTLPMSANE